MNDEQPEPLPSAPTLPPITEKDVDELLNSSDVIKLGLARESGGWRCVAKSIRTKGGTVAPTVLQAIHGAVVEHNKEWDKLINA